MKSGWPLKLASVLVGALIGTVGTVCAISKYMGKDL